MKELIFIFLLVVADGFAQNFTIKAGQGGKTSTYYCKNPGCAAKVTSVYCNDKLLNVSVIANCTGTPPPRKVCQHEGRAFVSTDTDAKCEFEGKEGHITSEKCQGNRSICNMKRAEENTQKSTETWHIFVGVLLGIVLLIIAVALYFYKKRKGGQPASDSDGAEPLRQIHNS